MVESGRSMNGDKRIRVGFILSARDWLGGRNYLRNLFAALHALPGNPIVPVVFTGKRDGDVATHFSHVEVVQTSILDRKSPAWFVRQVIKKVSARDPLLLVLLRHNVTVLSHSSHLGQQTSVCTLGWIPDFQHVHLPDFFSAEDRRQRNREFMDICLHCDKVILSSECAREDLVAFSPEHAHKAELLRFVASPAANGHAANLADLQRLYNFSGPYFLLPNQFWAHKNHRVVLSALKILKRRNEPLLVLATGSSEDFRNPSFFRSLMDFAAECDVLDCFRVLGLLPFDHLVGLMQHATAIINPSLFEGWSTSVEEAKSMGKQIILSDIPVHREQAPERGIFFPAEDSSALAEAMKAALDGFNMPIDFAMQAEANDRFVQRQHEFGDTYRHIVMRTLMSFEDR